MTMIKCPSCGNTIDVPEKKSALPWLIGCLVALVAIPFIVASIGLLAAIAIPSFMRARDTSQLNACVNNMRMLDAAKEQAGMENSYRDGDTVSEQEVSQYLKNGFSGLVCPKDGHYMINSVGQDPECSVHGPLSGALKGRQRLPNQPSDRTR